jgi:hypothetical protein
MHRGNRVCAIAVWGLMLVWPALADEPVQIDQWRVCAVSEGDFQKRVLPPGVEWFWVGHPGNSYQAEKVFAHTGPFVYYVHFRLEPFADTAKPLLLINGLPEGCVVVHAGQPVAQANQRQKGSDEFSVERWYRLSAGPIHPGPGDNQRIEIWAPSIRKAQDATVAPVSMIVFDDPDVLAKRVRQRQLRQPYLHEVEETEDPYVARHW